MSEIKVLKPLVVTFVDLCAALEPLHLNERARIDELHDIWMKGAPSPDSRILMPNHYDPRLRQPGNVEKRIVIHTMLAQWIMDTSRLRGFPYTMAQSLAVIGGEIEVS